MKLSIERATLLKAVSQAQSVVERRNTIPILANVLIEAEGDTVSFRATDLDIEVVDRGNAMVERAGATTVSAVMLHEIVRKLPDGALVSLTDDQRTGRLAVEAGRSTFSLATLPKEDFPVMASSEYASNFTAKAGDLRRLQVRFGRQHLRDAVADVNSVLRLDGTCLGLNDVTRPTDHQANIARCQRFNVLRRMKICDVRTQRL